MEVVQLGADIKFVGAQRAVCVLISDDGSSFAVELLGGGRVSVPIANYPRLASATLAQLARWELSAGGVGIHWPDLDEDLAVSGLVRDHAEWAVQVEVRQ